MTSPRPARDIDLSAWLTKSEVASLLGISEKTVERHHKRGALEQRMRPGGQGVRSVAVYLPEDVDALGDALRTAAPVSVLPAERAPAMVHNQVEIGGFDGLAQHLAALSTFAATLTDKQTMPVYVSLKQARSITGLSAQSVRELAASSAVKTMPFGAGVRYRRVDLEAL